MNEAEKNFKLSKALVVFCYLEKFKILENNIRTLFENQLTYIDKNLLYFYYGSKIDIYMDFDSYKITSFPMQFNDNEMFKKITTNQIIKLNQKNHYIDKLDDTIQSIQIKTCCFNISDACLKLINMRNKLAHEINYCDFKNGDIIELLSDEFIQKYTDCYDLNISYMDNDTKMIFSNLIYMDLILTNLS